MGFFNDVVNAGRRTVDNVGDAIRNATDQGKHTIEDVANAVNPNTIINNAIDKARQAFNGVTGNLTATFTPFIIIAIIIVIIILLK